MLERILLLVWGGGGRRVAKAYNIIDEDRTLVFSIITNDDLTNYCIRFKSEYFSLIFTGINYNSINSIHTNVH